MRIAIGYRRGSRLGGERICHMLNGGKLRFVITEVSISQSSELLARNLKARTTNALIYPPASKAQSLEGTGRKLTVVASHLFLLMLKINSLNRHSYLN